ncbi:MAG: 5-(carboxyamino)imidazole ribonucleotide mutase [Dehalococcoidia bacterium]
MPLVGVVMGSKSDEPYVKETLAILEKLGIDYEVNVISAHRTPERAREYGKTAKERGLEVLIAAAGGAAHLPGVLASWTTLPVIGVPLPTTDLKGVDALHAIVQMPGGIPVAAVAIGNAGARNAAYLAAEILALSHPEIDKAHQEYRDRLAGGQRA